MRITGYALSIKTMFLGAYPSCSSISTHSLSIGHILFVGVLLLLFNKALDKIRVVASDYAWGPELNPLIEFLKMLLQVDEASVISRLRTILLYETQHAIMGLALMVVMEE